MKKVISTLLISIVALTFCFGGVAYAQEDETLPDHGITPDSPLYFVDVWGEQLSLMFTFNAQAKAEKAMQYAGEKLAEMGDSGNSYGIHLHFVMIDRESGQTINPFLLLPQVDDTVAPTIVSINLIDAMADSYTLVDDVVLAPGQYRIVSELFDQNQDRPYTMAAYKVELYYNGEIKSSIQYEFS